MKRFSLLVLLCSVLITWLPVAAQEVPTATPTATLTPTATPTATLTPTATPTATPEGMDPYEPNDTPEQAVLVGVGTQIRATLHVGDVDWWMFMLKAGRDYRIDVIVRPGGDPRAALYTTAVEYVMSNDDCAPGDLSACLFYTAPADAFYLLEVTSQVPGLFAEYTLVVTELPPAPTSTPYPTPTPNDPFEPNNTFDEAAEISVGQRVNANLPPGDNDFFRLPVKPGLLYQCETTNLQGGVDTNIIVYDQHRHGIGGNDDRAPGDPSSLLQWWSDYQGWVYVLVGPVSGSGSYTLICQVIPPTPTPPPPPPTAPPAPDLPGGSFATATPTPTSTPIFIPTPTSVPGLAAGSNFPGTEPVPALPELPPISVVVYYDANNNNAPEPTEGIVDAVVMLQDATTNKPLTWARTDHTGYVQLLPPAESSDTLRVSIPYLGFSRAVRPGQAVAVQIKSQRSPALIP